MDINTSSNKIPNGFFAYPAIVSLILYVFCYQFAYPFSSTIFLYMAFGCFILWLIVGQAAYMSKQTALMALVVCVSVLGAFYTDNQEKGTREAILTVVTFVLMVAIAQNEAMLCKLKKVIWIFSFIIFIGVLLQFLFSDAMNNFLGVLLRRDSYEHLMWSYSVDGAFAGFSAYTADAAYFCATLFGFTIFSLLQNKEAAIGKKILKICIMVLSVFAVILTSKRGVAVALFIAFFVTYMIWKRPSFKTIAKVLLIVLLCVAAFYILSEKNEIISAFLQRFNSTDGDITTGRSVIWENALDGLSNKVIGMGTGAAYTIFDNGLHNIYLQLFYDHGIIGALVYIVFFLYNLRCAVKKRELMPIYIQILMLVYGMSGNPIYSNSFFIVYVIFSTVSLESDSEKEEAELQSA